MNDTSMPQPSKAHGPARRAGRAALRVALGCAAAAMLGLGQPTKKPAPFTPVEPGVVDLTSNAVSRRILQIDQRIPTGFDQVFKVDPSATPAPLSTRPMFARKSGALTVLFPRGEYVATDEGAIVPVIPPGSRMMIGEPDSPADPRAKARSLSAVDRSASAVAHRGASAVARASVVEPIPPTDPHLAPPDPRTLAPGMLTDEDYRVRRIRDLLAQAAAVEAARPDRASP